MRFIRWSILKAWPVIAEIEDVKFKLFWYKIQRYIFILKIENVVSIWSNPVYAAKTCAIFSQRNGTWSHKTSLNLQHFFNLLLKYLYQVMSRKVSSNVYVCKWLQFCLFLRFFWLDCRTVLYLLFFVCYFFLKTNPFYLMLIKIL
jgi:hypothetical protein